LILFFVNKFNDTDHEAPIVDRMARDSKEKLAVLSLNPLSDISNDFRLRYLKDTYNIPVSYLYNYCNPSRFYKFIGALVCSTYSGGSFRKNISNIFSHLKGAPDKQTGFFREVFCLMSGLFRSIMVRYALLDKFIQKIFTKSWVEKVYGAIKPSALVFDHASHLGLYNVGALMSVAKSKNIPTIDVPHGIPLYIKHSADYDRAKTNLIRNDKDFIVLHHRWWRDECVAHGLNPEKVTVLGSARFCKEWIDILHRIIPPELSLQDKGKGKLKVVFMEFSASRYHEYKDTARKTIERINKLDFIHFIFKPQTRGNILHFDLSSSVEVAYNANSVNLIKWADVVIVHASSIMIEVLLQDKVFIYPRFFHSDKMIYEEFGAGWAVDSYEELEEALKTLRQNPSYRPYSMENVKKYITEIVYNGQYGRDVLGDYKDLILGASKAYHE
jgi:hypothetical protein